MSGRGNFRGRGTRPRTQPPRDFRSSVGGAAAAAPVGRLASAGPGKAPDGRRPPMTAEQRRQRVSLSNLFWP